MKTNIEPRILMLVKHGWQISKLSRFEDINPCPAEPGYTLPLQTV